MRSSSLLTAAPLLATRTFDWPRAVFFGLVLVLALPIAMVRYVPAIDLPQHILVSALQFDKAAAAHQQYLEVRGILSPYSLFFLLAGALVQVVHYLTAAKIILVLYVGATGLGLYTLARRYHGDAWHSAFLGLFFVYNYPLEYGFIQFVIGIPLLLWGIWVADRVVSGRGGMALTALGMILGAAIFLSHVDILIVYGVALAALVVYHARRASKRATGLKAALLALPIACLSVNYLLAMPGRLLSHSTIRDFWDYKGLLYQLKSIPAAVTSTEPVRDMALAAGVCGLTLTALFMRRAALPRTFLFLFALGLLGLGLVIPRASFLGSWEHTPRFLLLAFALLGLSVRYAPSFRPILVAAGAALVVFVSGNRLVYYLEVDRATRQYVDTVTAAIPANSTVYNIQVADPTERIPPLLSAICYYHIERGGYSPFLFAFQRHVNGLYSDTAIPAPPGEWYRMDTTDLIQAAPRFDYLVVALWRQPLPAFFDRYTPNVVSRNDAAAIYRMNRTDTLFVYNGAYSEHIPFEVAPTRMATLKIDPASP